MNTTDTWVDCYWRGWGKELVPEAYSHPAKVSFPLAARIYAHIMAEGWVPFGSTVIDPFAGIGGFAYHVLFAGLNFVGVELEEKFVALGQQNIALWNRRYAGRFAKWGTARIVQGDSRHLLDVVQEAGCCVSSPPYAEALSNPSNNIELTGVGGPIHPRNYGTTPGNLGNLRADERGFDLALSSPPYISGGHHPDQTGAWGGRAQSVAREVAGYGQSDGQLGRMPEGNFAQAVVSSPPYEGSNVIGGPQIDRRNIALKRDLTFGVDGGKNYLGSDGQLGRSSGDSFWSAARLILAQTYAALRPGGEPVADGEGIEFCDCE